MSYFEFQYPVLLMLLPALFFFAYWLWKREQKNKDTFGHSLISASKDYNTWTVKFHWLPDLLKLCAMSMLIIVVARPRMVSVKEIVKGNGIDIVIAMDISSSMLARDFAPDRLSVGKELATEFVNNRRNDRIGLVIFSGESFTQCPLTVDHEILNAFIKSQEVGYLEDGTAIGMGLATAVNRMKSSKSKSKIVILLTDGENNKGYIDPMYAATLAQELGIKVYTIGIGSDEFAEAPIGKDENGDYVYDLVQSNIDEESLGKIASITGGKYFRAKSSEGLREIYSIIDKLEKNDIELDVLKRYKEKYLVFLFLSIIFLILSLLLSNFFIKKFN
jgi:Ca-activated chloride channel homolog